MSGRLDRPSRIAVLTAVLIAFVSAVLPVTGEGASAAAAVVPSAISYEHQCADVLIVGVAGSGQSGYGTEVQSAVTHLEYMISPHRSVRSLPLAYPAAGIPVLINDLTVDLVSGEWNYFESVGAGQVQLTRELGSAALACPDEKWILVGYSQGALVINQAAATLGQYVDRIAGVMMIADPSRSVMNFGRVNYGNAQRGDGIARTLGAYPAQTYPGDWNHFTVDVCMEADIVCDYRNWATSLITPLAGVEVHLTIPYDLITAAADSILPRVLAPSAPSTSAPPTLRADGPGAVEVSWQAFRQLGDPVQSYKVLVGSGGRFSEAATVGANTTSTLLQLQGGSTITVKIQAVTASFRANSPESLPIVVPPTVPAASSGYNYLGSTATSITFSWGYPWNDGGSPITHYRINLRTTFPEWQNVYMKDASEGRVTTIDGLTPGTPYVVTIDGCNVVGCATNSEPRVFPTFDVVPPAPTDVRVSDVTQSEATIAWAAPVQIKDTVGSYKVIVSDGTSEVTQSVDVPKTSLRFTGLKPATRYTATAYAISYIGSSTGSTATTFTTGSPLTPPAQLQPPVVTLEGNSGLHVSWTPPESVQAPILGYLLEWASGTKTGTVELPADYKSATITDLEGDLSYTVKIRARNSAGNSPDSSASASIYVPGEMPAVGLSVLTASTINDASSSLTISSESRTTVVVRSLEPQRWHYVSVLRAGSKAAEPLGWYLSDATGQIDVPLSSGLKMGNYRIAVQTKAGVLVGAAEYRALPATVPSQAAKTKSDSSGSP